MLSRSHVSCNCVSGAVLRVPQGRSLFCFLLFLCFFSLPVSLFLCLLLCLWCLDFLRSILSPTGLRSVSDEIDLKKSMHHKATANKKQRHRQRTQTQKPKKKQNNDLTWGTLNTVPETQFQETCDRESITLPMSFGLNWTKRGSAVHCELPYFKIVSKHNQPWWTKVKAPPWPLAQQPSTVLLIKWSGNQSVGAAEAVARQQWMQRRCRTFAAMWFWKQNLLGRARVWTKDPCVKEYLVKQWWHAVSDKIKS